MLKEAPGDDFASDLYGAAIERAYATACADETAARERAAVDRFADRTGLVALRDAVGALLDGTELGEAVRAQLTGELSEADDLDWPPQDQASFGKLARNSPCSPWTPGTTRTRCWTRSRTCWPKTIRWAPGCANNSCEYMGTTVGTDWINGARADGVGQAGARREEGRCPARPSFCLPSRCSASIVGPLSLSKGP